MITVTDQEGVEIIDAANGDATIGCGQLVARATARWAAATSDYCDDISATCVHLAQLWGPLQTTVPTPSVAAPPPLSSAGPSKRKLSCGSDGPADGAVGSTSGGATRVGMCMEPAAAGAAPSLLADLPPPKRLATSDLFGQLPTPAAEQTKTTLTGGCGAAEKEAVTQVAAEATDGGGGGEGEGSFIVELKAAKEAGLQAGLAAVHKHMGSVPKFPAVADTLSELLELWLTEETAPQFHEALRAAVGNGKGPRLSKLRDSFCSLFDQASACDWNMSQEHVTQA